MYFQDLKLSLIQFNNGYPIFQTKNDGSYHLFRKPYAETHVFVKIGEPKSPNEYTSYQDPNLMPIARGADRWFSQACLMDPMVLLFYLDNNVRSIFDNEGRPCVDMPLTARAQSVRVLESNTPFTGNRMVYRDGPIGTRWAPSGGSHGGDTMVGLFMNDGGNHWAGYGASGPGVAAGANPAAITHYMMHYPPPSTNPFRTSGPFATSAPYGGLRSQSASGGFHEASIGRSADYQHQGACISGAHDFNDGNMPEADQVVPTAQRYRVPPPTPHPRGAVPPLRRPAPEMDGGAASHASDDGIDEQLKV